MGDAAREARVLPGQEIRDLPGHGVEHGLEPGPVGPGEVRVRLQAATLNRVDLYMRDSGAGITHALPQVLGLDGAGTLDAVGVQGRKQGRSKYGAKRPKQ